VISVRARVVAWLEEARTPGEMAWRLATWAVLIYAAAVAWHAYGAGFDAPLLDRHAFRQTQTAISAYWILHGGPLFAYETPVFGAPYSIPFEFPLFQWLVALVCRVTRAGLEPVGRTVSIAFFLLTLVPFHRLLRRSAVSGASARLGLALLLVAPEYLYWSRTFLIESTALFFSVGALALGLELLEAPAVDRRLAWLFAAITLAMLVKVTTAFGYVATLGLLAARRFAWDRQRWARREAYGAFFAAAFVLPAIPLVAWTRFADHAKELNPFTHFITSAALHDWSYGTMEQKTATATWQTLWDRTMTEGFGSSIGFVAFCALALFGARRAWTAAALLAGAVGTYAVFTNLQLVHDYYQYSTIAAVVAVAALGIGAAETLLPHGRVLLLAGVALMVRQSVATYEEQYLPGQTHTDPGLAHVGEYVRAHTAESALVVVFGDDWSSVVPYYCQRHALMDRDNRGADSPMMRAGLERSAGQGNSVEAVISCNGALPGARDNAAKIFGRTPNCTNIASCGVCL
jgi:hypothetical protein